MVEEERENAPDESLYIAKYCLQVLIRAVQIVPALYQLNLGKYTIKRTHVTGLPPRSFPYTYPKPPNTSSGKTSPSSLNNFSTPNSSLHLIVAINISAAALGLRFRARRNFMRMTLARASVGLPVGSIGTPHRIRGVVVFDSGEGESE